MKILRFFTIACLLLLIPILSFGQHAHSKDSTVTQIKEVARALMTAAPNCALITVDANGIPRVRMMDAFHPEKDFTVWFGTNPKSRKVAQIKKNSNVTLYYAEKNNSGYVVLHGEAQLISNKKEKERYWKSEWEAFYPDKEESYVLIKVKPKWMEVVSYTNDLIGDKETWEPPSVHFD